MKYTDFKTVLCLLLMVVLITSACRLTDGLFDDPEQHQQTLAAMAAATLTAVSLEQTQSEPEIAQPTDTPESIPQDEVFPTATSSPDELPTPTLTPDLVGFISGNISYPAGFLPPQRVVAYDVDDVGVYYAIEVYDENTYTLEVSPGTYYVLAYPIDDGGMADQGGFSGAYSQMVPCGLHVDCEDHSLIPVEVEPGQTVTEIHPADWYLPEDLSRYLPSDPTLDEPGGIDGLLSYPSDFIPPLRVVVFSLDSDDFYEVYTPGSLEISSYRIEDIPPGTYHVLAYLVEPESDFCAAFTQYAKCGYWTADCDYDPELVEVSVFPGQLVRQVDLMHWDDLSNVDWPAEPER